MIIQLLIIQWTALGIQRELGVAPGDPALAGNSKVIVLCNLSFVPQHQPCTTPLNQPRVSSNLLFFAGNKRERQVEKKKKLSKTSVSKLSNTVFGSIYHKTLDIYKYYHSPCKKKWSSHAHSLTHSYFFFPNYLRYFYLKSVILAAHFFYTVVRWSSGGPFVRETPGVVACHYLKLSR